MFTTEPYRGNPVAVVLDASGLPTPTCSGSRTGRTCPRRRSCSRRRPQRPTTACASSRRRSSCPSPATRRSGRATRGSRRAARRATPAHRPGVRRRAGPDPARRRRAGVRGAAACPRSGPVDEADVAQVARLLGIAARTSSTPSGPTTGRAGWRSCCGTPRPSLRSSPATSWTWSIGVVGPHPDGARGRLRGAGVHHAERRRRSRTRSPAASTHQCAVAPGRRYATRPMSPPGHRARPPRPGAHHAGRGRHDLGGRRHHHLRVGPGRAAGLVQRRGQTPRLHHGAAGELVLTPACRGTEVEAQLGHVVRPFLASVPQCGHVSVASAGSSARPVRARRSPGTRG